VRRRFIESLGLGRLFAIGDLVTLPRVGVFDHSLFGSEHVRRRDSEYRDKTLQSLFMVFEPAIAKNMFSPAGLLPQMASDQNGPMAFERLLFRAHQCDPKVKAPI